jgi:hypothetical protein
MISARKTLVLAATVALMLTVISETRAQSSKGFSEEKVVRSVCRAVMTAARPSTFGQELDIAPYETKVIDERRIDVTFVVNWKGSVTGNAYQSRFTIKAYLGEKRIEIVGISYSDNAKSLVRPNYKNVQQLVPVANDALDILLKQ